MAMNTVLAAIALSLFVAVSADGRTFAQLACESRCLTAYKSCLLATRDVERCLDGYDVCAGACAGAIDVTLSGIDSDAMLGARGRRVEVTGHVDCPEGATFRLYAVSVSQPSTGAYAEGRGRGECLGEAVGWAIDAAAQGAAAFEAGDALACGIVSVRDADGVVSFRRWCVDVTLAE